MHGNALTATKANCTDHTSHSLEANCTASTSCKAYCVERLIEGGKPLAPCVSVGCGVVRVAAKELRPQDNEDEDEQDEQQHEVLQRNKTLQSRDTA